MFAVQDVLETFSINAAYWDTKNNHVIRKLGETRRLYEVLRNLVYPGMRILEVGCGTGKVASYLEKLDDETHIFSIDISLDMLRRSVLQLKRTNLFLNDAQNMCFRDSMFDLVVLQQVLHHIPDIKTTMREILRILKPGGYVSSLSVGCFYQENFFQKNTGGILADPLGRTTSYYLRQLSLDAGFHVITTFDDYFDMYFDSFDSYYHFLASIGTLNKIFKYKKPPPNAKELIYNYISKSKRILDGEIKINGHYITILAKK